MASAGNDDGLDREPLLRKPFRQHELARALWVVLGP
jgi:hypothetical protein